MNPTPVPTNPLHCTAWGYSSYEWFSDHCYKFFDGAGMTQGDAAAACEAEGPTAHLATVETFAVGQFLDAQQRIYGSTSRPLDAWVDGKATVEGGPYQFDDGSFLSPRNPIIRDDIDGFEASEGIELCVASLQRFAFTDPVRLGDMTCERLLPYYCEAGHTDELPLVTPAPTPWPGCTGCTAGSSGPCKGGDVCFPYEDAPTERCPLTTSRCSRPDDPSSPPPPPPTALVTTEEPAPTVPGAGLCGDRCDFGEPAGNCIRFGVCMEYRSDAPGTCFAGMEDCAETGDVPTSTTTSSPTPAPTLMPTETAVENTCGSRCFTNTAGTCIHPSTGFCMGFIPGEFRCYESLDECDGTPATPPPTPDDGWTAEEYIACTGCAGGTSGVCIHGATDTCLAYSETQAASQRAQGRVVTGCYTGTTGCANCQSYPCSNGAIGIDAKCQHHPSGLCLAEKPDGGCYAEMTLRIGNCA